MTDVLIYWRDYKHNWVRQFAEGHGWRWHSNAKLFGELGPGDRLWMVTSGANVRCEPKSAAFFVGVRTLENVIPNPGDDPAYPRDEYCYRAVCEAGEWRGRDDAVNVDHILRPDGRDQSISIGRFLQGPRRLTEEKVQQLEAALDKARQDRG